MYIMLHQEASVPSITTPSIVIHRALIPPRLMITFLKPIKDFYSQMTNPKYSAVTDVYSIMFLCDVIAFVIVVFGYSSFGPAVSSTPP